MWYEKENGSYNEYNIEWQKDISFHWNKQVDKKYQRNNNARRSQKWHQKNNLRFIGVKKIRDLEKQKQEEENSQIVQAVRSLKLTPAELMAFFSDPKNTFSASGQVGPKSEDTGKEENAHEEN